MIKKFLVLKKNRIELIVKDNKVVYVAAKVNDMASDYSFPSRWETPSGIHVGQSEYVLSDIYLTNFGKNILEASRRTPGSALVDVSYVNKMLSSSDIKKLESIGLEKWLELSENKDCALLIYTYDLTKHFISSIILADMQLYKILH